MDGLYWKTLLKWMIWGYPYFRKHPYDPYSTVLEVFSHAQVDAFCFSLRVASSQLI